MAVLGRVTGLCVGVVAAFVGVLLSPMATLAMSAQPIGFADSLTAGHRLTATNGSVGPTSNLYSRSGVFQLRVLGMALEIDENDAFADGFSPMVITWNRYENAPDYNPNDASSLTMQTDGNLVLRSHAGKVIWQTRTAGTGSHNYVQIRDDGNLVVYNASHVAVWASGTTRVQLLAGAGLGSGRELINKYAEQAGAAATKLFMRSDGNLVLYYGAQLRWTSNTHVAGSHLSMRPIGDLAIYAPNGTMIWHSRASGRDGYMALEPCGYLSVYENQGGFPAWHRPGGAVQTCI